MLRHNNSAGFADEVGSVQAVDKFSSQLHHGGLAIAAKDQQRIRLPNCGVLEHLAEQAVELIARREVSFDLYR